MLSSLSLKRDGGEKQNQVQECTYISWEMADPYIVLAGRWQGKTQSLFTNLRKITVYQLGFS